MHKAKEEEDEPFDILASAVTRDFRMRLGRGQKRWGEAVSAVLGDQALHAAAHVLTQTVACLVQRRGIFKCNFGTLYRHPSARGPLLHTSAYVSIRQHMPAYVSICRHTFY